jgi:hypothetical protein
MCVYGVTSAAEGGVVGAVNPMRSTSIEDRAYSGFVKVTGEYGDSVLTTPLI